MASYGRLLHREIMDFAQNLIDRGGQIRKRAYDPGFCACGLETGHARRVRVRMHGVRGKADPHCRGDNGKVTSHRVQATKVPMTILIRSGQQSDVPACVDIMCAWVDETDWAHEDDSHETLVDIWSGYFKIFQVWVAEAEGRIVGFCTRNDDNISALYVMADARNKGIGKRLLDRAKEDRAGITVWAFAKNERALKFYKREGLVEISRETEAGSNLVDIEHRWTKPG